MDAGYSWKSARQTATENMRKPAVAAELLKRRVPTEQIAKKTEQLRERILNELEKLAFSNVQDITRLNSEGQLVADFSKATRDQLAVVTKLKNNVTKKYNGKGEHVATETNVEYGLADKYRGLELLGKTLGMWGSEKVTVTIDVADRLLKARKKLLAAREGEDAEFSVVDTEGMK